jgi:hypothetical protein
MRQTEHILLESDFREVPDPHAARKVHARISFRSRLRWRCMQLEIFDYYYLGVRSQSRSTRLEYVLDLRFVGMPQVSRHIAWRWITASLLLASLVYGILRFGHLAPPWWQRHRLAGCAALTGAWAVATLVAAYRTTEKVRLFSTGGAAKLLEYTDWLGTLRDVHRFMAKVAAHVRLAATARRTSKVQHLRDEMREHARLKDLGVLCDPEYESAKSCILGKHAQAARSPTTRGSAQNAVADPLTYEKSYRRSSYVHEITIKKPRSP